MSNVYCKVNDPPRNKKRGTLKECVSKNQVFYYGYKKMSDKDANLYFTVNKTNMSVNDYISKTIEETRKTISPEALKLVEPTIKTKKKRALTKVSTEKELCDRLNTNKKTIKIFAANLKTENARFGEYVGETYRVSQIIKQHKETLKRSTYLSKKYAHQLKIGEIAKDKIVETKKLLLEQNIRVTKCTAELKIYEVQLSNSRKQSGKLDDNIKLLENKIKISENNIRILENKIEKLPCNKNAIKKPKSAVKKIEPKPKLGSEKTSPKLKTIVKKVETKLAIKKAGPTKVVKKVETKKTEPTKVVKKVETKKTEPTKVVKKVLKPKVITKKVGVEKPKVIVKKVATKKTETLKPKVTVKKVEVKAKISLKPKANSKPIKKVVKEKSKPKEDEPTINEINQQIIEFRMQRTNLTDSIEFLTEEYEEREEEEDKEKLEKAKKELKEVKIKLEKYLEKYKHINHMFS